MIKSWILVAFFIAFNWSAAQSYTNYSEKDGLPSNHIYKITQDSNGFIWIATDEGLVKYNGTDFKVFTTQEGLLLMIYGMCSLLPMGSYGISQKVLVWDTFSITWSIIL